MTYYIAHAWVLENIAMHMVRQLRKLVACKARRLYDLPLIRLAAYEIHCLWCIRHDLPLFIAYSRVFFPDSCVS